MEGGDKYRVYLVGEGEKDTQWRHGGAPKYDLVNQLFEQERTKEWPKGSLEETVQNTIKTWEMELSHKLRLSDFKSINRETFTLSVNGRRPLSGEETLSLGSYNALLATSMPAELCPKGYYNSKDETFESSHEGFRSAFPRGFAWEVLEVYSGPPVVAFKFRHWGHMEGNFKDHAPTGEMVEFIGIAVLKVDEQLRAETVEIYYDQGEFMAGLLKGPKLASTEEEQNTSSAQRCPFM
ncbi:pathogen-related protein [Carex littledalei]|uniref:Pathogen-related protein n=1 Tax=Carex littledalei TaxID=544730 RepID=A0A833QNL5_9POAL|nr:pathogen-related protein [Carex littledalei]